ncbi:MULTISPECIES: EAL domain-containing protein [Pseudomonas]|uniref:EAL domain-containing protein n=1 Tax=Pseudomonas TaxID=286 RepID=UPI001BED0649|nr:MULTISPECIES: EAL domain-containing protein [Pseudomonas]MBT2341054.1 EAL domain-containing protein [Pseudomonas fluorescens]MCD4529850.1 EAL domain-containing protein [Pseudomonas sp. C3-2018]
MKEPIPPTFPHRTRKAFLTGGQPSNLTATSDAERCMAGFIANVPGFVYTLRRSSEGRCSFPFASHGIVDMYGLQPEDVQDDVAPLHALVHPDDRPSIEAGLAESALTLSTLTLVFRICRSGLPERWIEARATPQREADGAIVWHGFMFDVTERKQGEHLVEEVRNRLTSVITTLPDYVWLKDAEGVYLTCNPAFERFFGALEADIVGKTDYDFVDVELADFFRQKDREAMDADTIRINEEWVTLAEDGRRILLETRKVSVYGANRSVAGVLGIGRDITERKRREDELGLLKYAIDHVEEAIFLIDEEARISYVNPHACRGLGYSQEELLGLSVPDIDPDYQQAIWPEHWCDLQVNGSLTFESRHRAKDGRIFPVEILANYFESSGQGYNMAMTRDITERKRLEALLHTREQEFRTLAENSPDTISRYDKDCRRRYANRKLIADMGGDLAQILGTTPIEFPGGSHAQGYMDKTLEVFETGEPRDFELHWQADGHEYCSHVRMSPEFDDAGQVAQVLAVGRDITEIDQYRKKVQYQAFYDGLTKLPNRALLFDRIQQEITQAKRYGNGFGLMLLDLDRFKEVNDTLGHEAGDRLLCEVAHRLKFAVRTSDTVARLGGDEFGILLTAVSDKNDLNTIAGKILQALAAPFMIDGGELFVSSSIGISLYPDDSVEMDALLRYSDMAMYYAKKEGRNNFQFYHGKLSVQSSERMELESALRKACGKGELALHFQPQIELPSGCVVGAEALLRWSRPGHGMVPPDRFIPIAEESGLIVDIGEWVLANACAAVADWNREHEAMLTAPLKMAVNVSTRQFLRNDLVGSVRRILADSGCRAQWLELEITESLLLDDSLEVARMLTELDQMGVTISIDDFGTGYSALSYLHRFPVAQIKIDKSFVQDVPHVRRQCELVKAMLSISAALQLEVVAEGVETQAQADYLIAQGCRRVQGYLFGKPMPRAAFEALLTATAIV